MARNLLSHPSHPCGTQGGPHAPSCAAPDKRDEGSRLRHTVAALVRQQDEHACWLRSIEEKLRATRERMLVYQATPQR